MKILALLTATEVFLHCAKALMRSKLWSEESKIARASFPTMGQMMNEQLSVSTAPETHDAMVARYQRDL